MHFCTPSAFPKEAALWSYACLHRKERLKGLRRVTWAFKVVPLGTLSPRLGTNDLALVIPVAATVGCRFIPTRRTVFPVILPTRSSTELEAPPNRSQGRNRWAGGDLIVKMNADCLRHCMKHGNVLAHKCHRKAPGQTEKKPRMNNKAKKWLHTWENADKLLVAGRFATRFARIIRNWNPYCYSASGRFARITQISDSRWSA